MLTDVAWLEFAFQKKLLSSKFAWCRTMMTMAKTACFLNGPSVSWTNNSTRMVNSNAPARKHWWWSYWDPSVRMVVQLDGKNCFSYQPKQQLDGGLSWFLDLVCDWVRVHMLVIELHWSGASCNFGIKRCWCLLQLTQSNPPVDGCFPPMYLWLYRWWDSEMTQMSKVSASYVAVFVVVETFR